MPRAPFRAFRPSRPAHWGAITLGSVLLLLILGSHSLGSPGRLLALTMAHPIVLRNSNGTEVDILPLGAIIQRLRVADRDGQVADVVLGFDSETPYRVSM